MLVGLIEVLTVIPVLKRQCLLNSNVHACAHACVCFLCCVRCRGERWLCRSRNDCLYSTVLLPILAKNNPAPQDREDRMEGGFFIFSTFSLSLSLTHYPPPLPHSFFLFVHYLHCDFLFLSCCFSPHPLSVPVSSLRFQWKQASHNASSAYSLSPCC